MFGSSATGAGRSLHGTPPCCDRHHSRTRPPSQPHHREKRNGEAEEPRRIPGGGSRACDSAPAAAVVARAVAHCVVGNAGVAQRLKRVARRRLRNARQSPPELTVRRNRYRGRSGEAAVGRIRPIDVQLVEAERRRALQFFDSPHVASFRGQFVRRRCSMPRCRRLATNRERRPRCAAPPRTPPRPSGEPARATAQRSFASRRSLETETSSANASRS